MTHLKRPVLPFALLAILLVQAGAAAGRVSAQTVDIPLLNIASSPSPVGSGARATALGGAFIAIADDATAASWNPGGLVQLERPEISAVGAWYERVEDFSDSQRARGDLANVTDTAALNYLSAALPFRLLERVMVASVNYQLTMDFHRDLNYRVRQDRPPILQLSQDVAFVQTGALNAVSPALSIQVVPRLMIGAAVNFWMDNILSGEAWESRTTSIGRGSVDIGGASPFSFLYQRNERVTGFFGVNVTAGLLWNPWRELRAGVVFKSPFRAAANRVYDWRLIPSGASAGLPPPVVVPPTGEQIKIDFPWSVGWGLSYRPSQAWTLSADVTYVPWADFTVIQTDPVTGQKVTSSPFTGLPEELSDVGATWTVRAGTEYLFILEKYLLSARGGLSYDPQPVQGGTDDYFGVSVGGGFLWKKVSFDVSYTFRFSTEISGDLLSGVTDSLARVMTHQVLFSSIFKF